MKIRLVGRQVLDERFVDPGAWTTILQINAGEERKIARQISRSETIVVEEQSQRTLQANVSLGNTALGELTSALQSALNESRKSSHTVTHSETASTEQTFRLPAEPDPSGPVYVKARLFQRAPVYRKILVTLSAVCECCGLSSRVPIIVLQDSGLQATRHQDHLSDGSVNDVETGDVSS